MTIKRWIFLALLLILLPACAQCTEWADLSVGSRSDEVVRVKERLFELGYYRSGPFTRQFTEDTAEKIKLFQRANGLDETGVADAETVGALFSEDARRAPRPTMRPLCTPAPTPAAELPPRDEEGYLAGEGEFFYENPEEGLWRYLSPDIQITIVRRKDSQIKLEWFETDILTRNGEGLFTVATDPEHPGKSFRDPAEVAKKAGLVLGFSDDFYANRINKKETVGIIVRDGKIISRATNRQRGHYLPNLDMMAQYPDGTLAVYECNERTAEELVADGAVNVFSFGPILIRDGEIEPLVYENYKSLEPRHALGMIAPGHYFLLSVQGRTRTTDGTVLQRVAEMLLSHGVTQALNLDGGNTMALVFRGKILNEPAIYNNKKFIRTVTSLIGVGHTDSLK